MRSVAACWLAVSGEVVVAEEADGEVLEGHRPVRQGRIGLAGGVRGDDGIRLADLAWVAGRNKQTIAAILDELTPRLVFADLASALLILVSVTDGVAAEVRGMLLPTRRAGR